MTADTAETMVRLYRNIVQADLDPTDCVTAELVKTAENAYRDVQIAFANEVALICEAIGGDVWKVRELVNKSPGRQMLLPGAGVGGHCIPKDPWLLTYGADGKGVPIHLIPAARAVNNWMPVHLTVLLQQALASLGYEIDGARILVMGYSYMEESDDTRNSPSEVLVTRLKELNAQVVIHDPFVPGFQGDLLSMAEGCDAAVVMVKHRCYRQVDLAALRAALHTKVLVDGRQLYSSEEAGQAGLIYSGIGLGAGAG
jgi:UDP-N-acetyl-D-mannosaminuronic acid dehydrogenase